MKYYKYNKENEIPIYGDWNENSKCHLDPINKFYILNRHSNALLRKSAIASYSLEPDAYDDMWTEDMRRAQQYDSFEEALEAVRAFIATSPKHSFGLEKGFHVVKSAFMAYGFGSFEA